MPCDLQRQRTASAEAEATRALKKLEQQLQEKSACLVVGQDGSLAINGWQDRGGYSDLCAIRALEVKGSWAYRQALAQAEALAGRSVNKTALAVGWHSHDGGSTWGVD